MTRNWNKVAAACIVTMVATCGVYAAGPDVAGVIAARKANYKEIGGGFKTINDELKSGAPDMNALRPIARDIASRAAYTLKYFPKGSGPESKVATRAKAEIWTNQADFLKIQQEMIEAAKVLNVAATAGDVAGVQAARMRLGGTCKSCHDRYREPT